MNSKAVTFVSLDLIANKILKHPLMKSVNYEDIIDYALTVIKLCKSPGAVKEETCFRRIENHLVQIPKQSLSINAVEYVDERGNQTPMRMSSNTLGKQFNKLDTKIAYGKSIQSSFDYSDGIYNDPGVDLVVKETDVFKVSTQEICSTFKYQVNNNHVVCSMESGKVMLVFNVINTDEDGIPLIVNSEALIKAIENYIKTQVFEVLVDLGKLSEGSLARAEREYCWYIGQAQTEFAGLSNVDEMESFINEHVSLFNVSSLHSDRYESSSDKEHVNIL
jgi:hypothetical protein